MQNIEHFFQKKMHKKFKILQKLGQTYAIFLSRSLVTYMQNRTFFSKNVQNYILNMQSFVSLYEGGVE